MNRADSERLSSALEGLGLQEASAPREADVIVLNSCVVRQSAEEKVVGMVTSLKPALSSSYFSQLSPEQQFEVLDAFWSGVKLVMPTAFDDPQRYVIQKALGVVVMHLVLLTVIEVMRSRGRSLKEPEDYADTLREALLTLEGSTANDEMARGAGFWLSGPNGAAGTFSSSAGKRVLTSKIKHGLPEMVLE